jgi:signal transduction histidine kinase
VNGDATDAVVGRGRPVVPALLHDMGNQLTVILGFAEMLLEEQGELAPDTVLLAVEAIVRNAREMRRLLEAASAADRPRPSLDGPERPVEPATVGSDPWARR